MIYYSLTYPFLTYGVLVWCLTFPSFLTQLFIIPKKAITIISFSEPKSHSEPLFKYLSLLKLNDIIESQILSIIVYKWSRRLLPSYFSGYFKFNSSVHSYSIRQSCNSIQLFPEGEVKSGGYIHRSSPTLRGIVVLVFTKSDGKKYASSISSSETFAKRRTVFLSVRKTVNIQGYSELREPIKTRENCYPLIW